MLIYRQQEVKTIESTELYKTQYEQLLQEYNQYLEDLESVQSKLKGLETLKTTYEEENSSLKTLCERYKSKADALEEKVNNQNFAKLRISGLSFKIVGTYLNNTLQSFMRYHLRSGFFRLLD